MVSKRAGEVGIIAITFTAALRLREVEKLSVWTQLIPAPLRSWANSHEAAVKERDPQVTSHLSGTSDSSLSHSLHI